MVRLGQQINAAWGKTVVAGHPRPVAEGPGDEHGHDHRLAAARGHLAGVPGQGLHRAVRRFPEEVEIAVGEFGIPARFPSLPVSSESPDFIEEDNRFRRFQLAEEETPGPVPALPVPEEILRDVCRPLPAGVAPALDVGPQFVHQGQVPPILLQLQGKLSLPGVHIGELVPVSRRTPPGLQGGAPRLPVVFPVLCRFVIGLADHRAFHGLDEDGFFKTRV